MKFFMSHQIESKMKDQIEILNACYNDFFIYKQTKISKNEINLNYRCL